MRLTITATLAFLCAGLFIPVGAQTGSVSDREQVLKAEEEFRQAKMKNDTVALERLVADEYYGMNQWGAKRDKAQLIALFHDFQTEALVPTNVTVRLSGDHPGRERKANTAALAKTGHHSAGRPVVWYARHGTN